MWSSREALSSCPGPLFAGDWAYLWDAMVSPFTRMTISGVIFYRNIRHRRNQPPSPLPQTSALQM